MKRRAGGPTGSGVPPDLDRDADGMHIPFYAHSGTTRPAVVGTVGSSLVDVADVIAKAGANLTRSERRVAEVVLAQPQLVAFGTVSDLAETAQAGAATVVRLAGKLGYDGFTGLQQAVQSELAGQLRPAAQRIREQPGHDSVERHLHLETANLSSTLGGVSDADVADVVDHVADGDRRVRVLSGDASAGVARQFVADLGALRDEVAPIDGNDVAVQRMLSLLRPSDAVVAIDVRRYDRWVIEAARQVREAGCWMLAVTDSRLSPLATLADRTVTVSAVGGGPFESHVGTLAFCNVVVAGVAARLRGTATERLDRAESAWRRRDSLTDG